MNYIKKKSCWKISTKEKKKSCWKSKQIYILWNFKEKNYVTKKKRYLIINLVHQLTVKLKEKSARQTPKLLADDAIEWRSEKKFLSFTSRRNDWLKCIIFFCQRLLGSWSARFGIELVCGSSNFHGSFTFK